MSPLLRILPVVVFGVVSLVIRQDTRLDTIYVLDRSSVARIAADYSLTVDGVSVPVVHVAAGPHAISAIVLFDVSSSMWPVDVEGIAKRIATSGRSEDAIYLGTFADRILFSQTRVTDSRSASSAAREVRQSGGSSPLWDALLGAAPIVGRAGGLRCILVFTDARATGNDHGSLEVIERLAGSGAIVSAVSFESAAPRGAGSATPLGSGKLQALVEITGGDSQLLRQRSDSPSTQLMTALSDLRGRTRLDFRAPVRDGAFHDITLTVEGKTVRVPRFLKF